MSSNGSNDSLFGSQGSTRNFTSLLNPTYLQSSNGKESHKRETDGKCFNMVTYFHKILVLITVFIWNWLLALVRAASGLTSFYFAHPARKNSHVACMWPPTLCVLFAVHHDIDLFNVS
jgi:hypothetical protein